MVNLAKASGRAALLAAIALGMAPAVGVAGPLDPMQFASLGTLNVSGNGTYTIDTTKAAPTLTIGSTVYTGVVSGGVAVFDFSSITLANGVTLTALKGAGMPVALLSQSNAYIGGQIDVSAFGSSAGAGASNSLVGGNGASSSGGGGGGLGGPGGAGSGNSPGAGGGSSFAPPSLTLQGGSHGGAGSYGPFTGIGGGGGGAIEIGAYNQITIAGEVDAIGGNGPMGGGGSGGEIYLHASTVLVTGTLDVQGGTGTFGAEGQGSFSPSGGGGGGLIEVDYNSQAGFYLADTPILAGGAGGIVGGNSGTAGRSSVDPFFTPASVPEPSSLALLGTSTLGLLGIAAGRRRFPRRGDGRIG